MKVQILKDGETVEVNESYGARLIEQGRAVVIPPKVEKKPEESTDKTPPAEKAKAVRKK